MVWYQFFFTVIVSHTHAFQGLCIDNVMLMKSIATFLWLTKGAFFLSADPCVRFGIGYSEVRFAWTRSARGWRRDTCMLCLATWLAHEFGIFWKAILATFTGGVHFSFLFLSFRILINKWAHNWKAHDGTENISGLITSHCTTPMGEPSRDGVKLDTPVSIARVPKPCVFVGLNALFAICLHSIRLSCGFFLTARAHRRCGLLHHQKLAACSEPDSAFPIALLILLIFLPPFTCSEVLSLRFFQLCPL